MTYGYKEKIIKALKQTYIRPEFANTRCFFHIAVDEKSNDLIKVIDSQTIKVRFTILLSEVRTYCDFFIKIWGDVASQSIFSGKSANFDKLVEQIKSTIKNQVLEISQEIEVVKKREKIKLVETNIIDMKKQITNQEITTYLESNYLKHLDENGCYEWAVIAENCFDHFNPNTFLIEERYFDLAFEFMKRKSA